MAIEKMKKLRLMAVRSQKEALLRDLLLLGCVQLTEPEQEMSDPSISAMVKREGSELLKYRAQFASLSHAVELVDKYAPVKTKALAPKPEIDCGAFLDDSSIETNLELADKITADDERIKRIAAEESRERGVIESLRPWETLDLPLECAGTEKTSAVMGILPGNADFGAVQASVAAVTQEAEIFQIYADKVQQCVVLVCFKGDLPKIQEALRVYSFAIASFGMTGTAAENIKASEKTLQDLADERTALIADITAKGAGRDELKLCADRLETKTGAAEAEDRIYGMDSAVAMEGWYPLERETGAPGASGEVRLRVGIRGSRPGGVSGGTCKAEEQQILQSSEHGHEHVLAAGIRRRGSQPADGALLYTVLRCHDVRYGLRPYNGHRCAAGAKEEKAHGRLKVFLRTAA
jgi:V/A-type H+-transporting ATPase subunit I